MESDQGLLLKRRSHRTNVTLPGRCIWRLSTTTESKGADDACDITIDNISKHGIGFRFINPVKVNVNDMLRVRFALESEQGVMEKNVVVKRTEGRMFVGAEFVLA